MNQPKNPVKYLLLSFLLIGIDQASKLLVHQYMEPGFSGQIALIGDWFKLHYVLNPGMAFGMQLGHEYGKLFLTLFRLVAMGAIAWYLISLARRGAAPGLLWALSMILAGAVGNVIDSTFYGVWLGNAPYGSPTPWFHGQVIDMVFVDFWEGFVPDWVPVWGGQYYSTPIFNIADACIFVGVCTILIFQSHFFTPAHEEDEHPEEISVEAQETNSPEENDYQTDEDLEAERALPREDVPLTVIPAATAEEPESETPLPSAHSEKEDEPTDRKN
ncbi:lipoprotein signal peptidase [Arundinibacter roseus]|uniref:Lipoprotein signal peptidase n=1 Tax=Arundinibacter roseus TaxID=2070510 RepID=A0A4R4K774_9BACT|nr:lipoprotein signal peptidase [Arundinibacter roseus]TDB63407.1 lipoprotein signal peptidase [Arundinibacter roseus]